jgi:hypothetical protein
MPAAIIPAVIGGATAVYGASKQASAAKDAAKAQQKGTDATIAEQKRQFDLSRSDQMPWLDAGKSALGQQQALLSGDFSKFYSSPDYQYALDQGMQGLDRSAAARGKLFSGGYGQDLTKYAQGMATQNYNNFYGKLAGLSNTGQGTATNLGALGQNYANAYGNAQQNTANARASSYTNQANAWGNAATQIGGIAGNYFGSKVTPSFAGTPYTPSASQWALPNTSNNSWYTGVGSPGWGG